MLSLTATELPRFMACNGSKVLGGIEPFNPSTEQTDEGNAAHWLCEQPNPEELVGQKAPNGLFITADMLEYCQEYINFIRGRGEVETDTSYIDPNGKFEIRGRADFILFDVHTNTFTVADLKYGWRIVEPVKNWTLMSHAINYCNNHNIGNDDTKFIFKIFQPRAFHPEGTIREWVITGKELKIYAQELFSTLTSPSSKVCTSSHCYKCPSITQCPAAQLSVMNAIDISEKAFDNEIDNETLSWMLANLKRAQEVLKQSYDAYQDLALHRLSGGQQLKGFAAKQALGITTWNDDVNIEFIKTMSNIDISVQKMMTPAQAKKAGVPEELIKVCTHRPDNGIKLVQVDETKLANKLFGKKGE